MPDLGLELIIMQYQQPHACMQEMPHALTLLMKEGHCMGPADL